MHPDPGVTLVTRTPFRLGILALILLALLFGGLPSRAEEAPPPVDGQAAAEGQVTLPLDAFLKLKRGGASTSTGGSSAAVPVPFMFSKGHYRLSARTGWVQAQGKVSLQVYQSGWLEIPLLPEGVVLERARLDGKPLALYRKEGQFHFLVDRPGAHTLEATWSLPVVLSGGTRSVALKTPASSVSSVTLVLPGQGMDVTTSPALPLRKRSEGGRLLVEAAIPGGASQEVTFSWTPLRADPALHGKGNREPARISARVYDLVTVSDNEVHSRIRIDYTILRNEVDRFTLRVPLGAEVDEVTCPNLSSWSEQEKGGSKEILVKLSAPVSGSQTLAFTLAQALKDPDSTWTLPAVEVVGAWQVKGSLGIGSTGGIEIQPGKTDQVRPIDVSELPPEIREQASFALVRAYEYHRQPWSLQLVTKKGQELPVLTAAADRAEGLTLVTRDGKLVTTFLYQVRNNQKQSLVVKLPEGSTLLTTTVEGRPAKPVQGPGGEIRLPLVASAQEGQAAFPVEITYLQEPGGSSLFGRHALRAPQVDVPVSVLNWTLYLPLDQWVYHVGGTMRRGSVQDVPEPASGLVETEALEGGAAGPQALEKDASEAQALRREVAQEEILGSAPMAQMVQEASRGTLPVKFTIPARGQSFQFSRLVVTGGEVPEVDLDFYSERLQWLAAAGALLLALGLGLPQTRRQAGLEPLAIAVVVLWVLAAWTAGTPLQHALLWATRGLYAVVALWLYRNRAWIVARLRGQGGEP